MNFLCTITILDREYEITTDGFGVKYIDGILIDEFLENASTDILDALAAKGLRTIAKEPERAHDIIERNELTMLEPFL